MHACKCTIFGWHTPPNPLTHGSECTELCECQQRVGLYTGCRQVSTVRLLAACTWFGHSSYFTSGGVAWLAESDLTLVPYCDHAPQAVLDNPGQFHYLLARDPDTGSFSDYTQQFFSGKEGKKKLSKVTE